MKKWCFRLSVPEPSVTVHCVRPRREVVHTSTFAFLLSNGFPTSCSVLHPSDTEHFGPVDPDIELVIAKDFDEVYREPPIATIPAVPVPACVTNGNVSNGTHPEVQQEKQE